MVRLDLTELFFEGVLSARCRWDCVYVLKALWTLASWKLLEVISEADLIVSCEREKSRYLYLALIALPIPSYPVSTIFNIFPSLRAIINRTPLPPPSSPTSTTTQESRCCHHHIVSKTPIPSAPKPPSKFFRSAPLHSPPSPTRPPGISPDRPAAVTTTALYRFEVSDLASVEPLARMLGKIIGEKTLVIMLGVCQQ